MGCAKSKHMPTNESNHSISHKTKKTYNIKVTELNCGKEDFIIPVLETPPNTPPDVIEIEVFQDAIQEAECLDLKQVLERSRRAREDFYKNIITTPQQLDLNNTFHDLKFATPTSGIKTQYQTGRVSASATTKDEHVSKLLRKVFDCNVKHRLTEDEFLLVKNHLICLLNSIIECLFELKDKSSDRKIIIANADFGYYVTLAEHADLLIVEYRDIKDCIENLKSTYESVDFNLLIRCAIKLDQINKKLNAYYAVDEAYLKNKDHFDELDRDYLLSKNPKLAGLINQLDKLNLKVPKNTFICKCESKDSVFFKSKFNQRLEEQEQEATGLLNRKKIITKTIDIQSNDVSAINEIVNNEFCINRDSKNDELKMTTPTSVVSSISSLSIGQDSNSSQTQTQPILLPKSKSNQSNISIESEMQLKLDESIVQLETSLLSSHDNEIIKDENPNKIQVVEAEFETTDLIESNQRIVIENTSLANSLTSYKEITVESYNKYGQFINSTIMSYSQVDQDTHQAQDEEILEYMKYKDLDDLIKDDRDVNNNDLDSEFHVENTFEKIIEVQDIKEDVISVQIETVYETKIEAQEPIIKQQNNKPNKNKKKGKRK